MLSSRVQYDTNRITAAHIFLSDSDKRRSLTLYPPSTGDIWVSNEPDVASGTGIHLAPNGPVVYLDVDWQGDCVQKSWYAVYSTAAEALAFVEALHCGEKGNPPWRP